MTGTIKVKAFAVLLDASRTRHVIYLNRDPTKHPAEFHRLLGGHVEFGERSADAVVREIAEELGAELTNTTLLGVVENVFEYAGRPGHEVVFIYGGTIADDVVPAEGGCSTTTDRSGLSGDGSTPTRTSRCTPKARSNSSTAGSASTRHQVVLAPLAR